VPREGKLRLYYPDLERGPADEGREYWEVALDLVGSFQMGNWTAQERERGRLIVWGTMNDICTSLM
jgi:hypothetical protein